MFRFTIRDVFWLTMLAALSLAWWLEHRSLSRHNETLQRRLTVVEKESAQRKDSLESLALENARLDEFVRRRQLLNEATPGVYFLGPETRGVNSNLRVRGSSINQSGRLGGNIQGGRLGGN